MLRTSPTLRSSQGGTRCVTACVLALVVLIATGCVSRYRVNSDELARAKEDRRANYYIAAEESDGDLTFIRSRSIRKDVVDLDDGTSDVSMRGPSLGLWVGGALSAAAGIAVLATAGPVSGDVTIDEYSRNILQISGGVVLCAAAIGMFIPNIIMLQRFDDQPSHGFADDVGPFEDP